MTSRVTDPPFGASVDACCIKHNINQEEAVQNHMTITINERELVEQAATHRSAIAVAETALAAVGNERKAIRRAAELELRKASKTALHEAQADADQKAEARNAAKRNLKDLERRWNAGDAAVSVEDYRMAELSVKRAEGLHANAQAALGAPKREYAIDTSDSLLAERAVEILSANAKRLGLDGFDIISFKRSEAYEPAMLPALVVSQTTASGNYGKAQLRGSVSLKFFTDDDAEAPALDPVRVAEVFDEHRCDVTLQGSTLSFSRCVYETPMLANGPDLDTLRQWGSDMTGILHNAINEWAKAAGIRTTVALIVSQSYGYQEHLPGVQVTAATFETNGGDAVGYVDIEVSLEEDGGGPILTNAAESSKNYLLDVPTDMGLVKKVEVSVVEKQREVVVDPTNYDIYGRPRQYWSDPAWVVQYKVHTKFEPMATAVND